MSKLIPLTQGQFAIVDDTDFDWLNQWKWHAKPTRAGRSEYYAVRHDHTDEKWILMHRVINNTPSNLQTDHINGNGLDNRRFNLRNATVMQNGQNTPKCKTNRSSRYKGVTWDKRRSQWYARIRIAGKMTHLGSFTSELDAAKAYDAAARIHFGEFARLNFPEE